MNLPNNWDRITDQQKRAWRCKIRFCFAYIMMEANEATRLTENA